MPRPLPLLLALAAVAVTACGGEELSSAPCTESPGGSTVVLEYRSAPGQAQRSAERLCSRLAELGPGRYRVETTGAHGLRVVARDTEGARAALQTAIEGASFSVYDWEPNVLGNRGPAAPFTARSKAQALAARSRSGSRPVAVVEDQRVPGQPSSERRWFAIEDDPALTARHIANPRAATDEITGEPTVSFDFTDAGRLAFRRLTAEVAARAARAAAAQGASEASFQHFAIVVDGRVLSLPALDAAAAPRGIDAPGAQINGVGSRREARLLARRLGVAPLLAQLEPVSAG